MQTASRYCPEMALHSTLLLILGLICAIGDANASQKQKFCGPKLARALAELCDAYPTLSPPPSKRSSRDAKGMAVSDDYNLPNWPTLETHPMERWVYTVVTQKDKPNWMKLFYPKHPAAVQNNVFDSDDDYNVNEIIPGHFMLGKRGVRRGIVEECCHTGCTYEYLFQTYCA